MEANSNSRFLRLLQQRRNPNNGTTAGGLASVIDQALEGYLAGEDKRQAQARLDAQTQALQGAMQAATGIPDGQIQWDSQRPDGTGEMMTQAPGVAPDRGMAARLLSATPETAGLGFQMQNQDLIRKQTLQDQDAAFRRQKEIKQMPMSPEQYAQQIGVVDARTKATLAGKQLPLTPEQLSQQLKIASAKAEVARPPLDYIQESERVKKKVSAEVKKETLQPKALSALQGLERQSNTVVKHIDNALALVSPYSTGYGSFLSVLPNTDARALRNEIDTIKANVGFDKLQQMRDASPTGGALGGVSENENRLLQAVNGALDPGQKDQLVTNLKAIRELYPQVLAEKRAAYISDYGDRRGNDRRAPAAGGQAGNQPSPGSIKAGDIKDGYRFNGGDPASPASWSKI